MAPMTCSDCMRRGKVVFMVYSRKSKHYICPDCTGVFTPIPKDDDYAANATKNEVMELMYGMYKANLPPKEPIPAGGPLKGGGGSKSKGQSKKGLMKKKSLSQLYREL
ncbi:hypothetical protein [Anaerosinus massiliensis]|uniref:hypothetical protein n=1 Tax=Massilibacillus massiliensis TaxID=1806837 RepID=UPI000DA63470|nr:hypothetical protein [Massilibacillus massiliensis]